MDRSHVDEKGISLTCKKRWPHPATARMAKDSQRKISRLILGTNQPTVLARGWDRGLTK